MSEDDSDAERDELRTRLRRFERLIEATSDYIAMVDIEGRYFFVNPAGMAMVGRPGEDPRELDIGVLIPADEVERHRRDLFPHVREHGLWTGESTVLHKDGRAIPVSKALVMTYAEDGRPNGFAAICRDITETKRAQAELRAAKDSAEAANRAKSVFLASMSHELRTPLNAILGFTQLLARDASLSDDQREKLGIIGRSGKHLLELINDVLEVSKIEAGRVTLREAPVDLTRLLDDLRVLFSLRAEKKGLALDVLAAEDVPHQVLLDQGKLRQVLINLLGNALKFTERGALGLRVRRARGGSDRLRFEVEDTGPGIPEEARAAIFESFVQLGRVSSSEGTGLGLRISQEFVRMMGGELTVASAVGRGSCFAFEIPAPEATAVELTLERADRRVLGLAPGQRRCRLLVVEDHADSRLLLVSLLELLGFEVRQAANGAEAVAACQAWPPDLVWMDMHMPVLDGREATRRIKALPGGHEIVVIALTASAFEEERGPIRDAGCDGFVLKPYLEADITAALETHLGLRFEYTAPSLAEGAAGPARTLERSDLSSLPAGWRNRAHALATEADDEGLTALLDGLPEASPRVREGLRQLMADFRFDRIMALTAPDER